MVGELVIEEGDLEVLRDRTNGSADDLEPVTVATAGGFLLSALGAGELATRGTPRLTKSTLTSAPLSGICATILPP